jgi:branched-chain amino acid transport system substrate-binding protein
MRSPGSWAVLLLLMTALGAGCGRKDRTVRIGVVDSVSGEAAAFGQSIRRGCQLAAEDLNAQGGILGKPVKLSLADDKGDPAEGVKAINRFIHRDRVAGIVGPGLSRVALAGAPMAQAAGVPLVTPASTHLRVTEVGDCIFRACATDATQGTLGAGFAFRDLGARRAACLFNAGEEYCVDLALTFRESFRAHGGQMAAFEGHPPGTADFQPFLAPILQAKPDLLFVPDIHPEAAAVVRKAREMGFHGPILGGDGWDHPGFPQAALEAAENTFYTAHFSRDGATAPGRAFVERFRGRFGEDPDAMAVLGYDALAILADGIRRAGTLESKAVRQALAATDLEGLGGRIRFDSRRNAFRPMVVLELRKGRPVQRLAAAP